MKRYKPYKFEEDSIKLNDTFNYKGLTWKVIKVGSTQSKCEVITLSKKGLIDIIDNKEILKNKISTIKPDLDELIGKWKAEYGNSVKQLKTDSEFKKLSFADKEYVIDEFNQEGRRD